jgi:large subunit ribosomal protein L6
MSRVASNPISLPDGVELKVEGKRVTASGKMGELSYTVHELVRLVDEESCITFMPEDESKEAKALSGTMRALLYNMVVGVSEGFQKKLELQGVGYRAQASGKRLTLQLGFSHPIEYEVPEGINLEAPSQTEIVISGRDKQQVGQVCAEIRSFRPPEPYKGKGVRYSGERVRRKEAKKK